MFFNRESLKAIMNYRYAMKDKETYYIDPPTKIVLGNLIWVWGIFFVTFLLSFNGLESFFVFLWVPLIILLNFYSDMWSKVGFSLIVYWLMNIIVIVGSFFISRGIHFIVKFILNLIGVI